MIVNKRTGELVYPFMDIEMADNTRKTPTITQALDYLRAGLELIGFATRDSDRQQEQRIGNRIYIANAGYSMGQYWVKLTVRRVQNPKLDTLGRWETNDPNDAMVETIFNSLTDTLTAHEKKVKGE